MSLLLESMAKPLIDIMDQELMQIAMSRGRHVDIPRKLSRCVLNREFQDLPAQSSRGAHSGRVYIRVFKEVSVCVLWASTLYGVILKNIRK